MSGSVLTDPQAERLAELVPYINELAWRYSLHARAILTPQECGALVAHVEAGRRAALPWAEIITTGPVDLWRRIEADPKAGQLHKNIADLICDYTGRLDTTRWQRI